VSTEVEFWNTAVVELFLELVYTSAEFSGIPGKDYTEFQKKYQYYVLYTEFDSETVTVPCLQWWASLLLVTLFMYKN
jgi:tRNA uridine 5-carbamoylmethylation protein Kti12